jgi:hypothetical protein
MERLGHSRTRLSLETCDETMDITQDPKIFDQLSVEREERDAVPPDMPSARLYVKELSSVIAMEPKLSEDLVPLFDEGKDVRRVAVEGAGNEPHIADELLVADQLWTQRSAEREVRVEDLWHQRDVRVVPHFLVEDPHDFLSAGQADLCEIQGRFVHVGELWMRGLTFDMSGSRKPAQLAAGSPLDGVVRFLPADGPAVRDGAAHRIGGVVSAACRTLQRPLHKAFP